MAQLIRRRAHLLLCLAAAVPLAPARAEEAAAGGRPSHLAGLPPELADEQALAAFEQYWDAFEQYESRLVTNGRKQFKAAWEELRKNYRSEKAKISHAQLEALQKSAERYRRHLDEHAGAESRPYVMLNLAQILNLIGDHLAQEAASSANFAKSDALAQLRSIEEQYPQFAYRDQALYLRALILESLDRQDEAVTAWQTLAKAARTSLYTVHAHIALGDHFFKTERNADAMRSYERALTLLTEATAATRSGDAVDAAAPGDPDYEALRINYRLTWAAYRAGELNTAVKAGAELLTPGRRIKSADQRLKIQQDAVDLIGDALYEANNLPRTKLLLQHKELLAFAPRIGLRTLARYVSGGVNTEAASLGEFLSTEFPLSEQAPEILRLTADAWQASGKAPQRLQALERLALLLPSQSLWRSRFKSDLRTLRAMEEQAAAAAAAVAAGHYDTGLAAGNTKAFLAAAGFYDILLDHEPNGKSASDWRLRKAHCHFFAGRYDDAAKMYAALKTDFKVDADILQIAAYQLVLTNERRWREQFALAGERGGDAVQDAKVAELLAALAKSIDEFAARFPGQARAVDLLLVGASANRDMSRIDDASRYWQRALVSQPDAAQRGMAIRGLVFAQMKNGSPGDVVEAVRRFLKLEDWRALGANLGNELRGVLSIATLDEGKRLADSGKVLEAGQLLTQLAEEFTDLPDRDRIFRDGAFMLAIAGDWSSAQDAAERYFKSGLRRNQADMTYLHARALEYQLRLPDAAAKYIELGETFPGHNRATASLVRAEKLALAEGDFALAAAAALALAENAKTPAGRLDHYARAVDGLDKAGKSDAALSIAKKRLRAAGPDQAERLRSQLMITRLTYKTGREQEALDELAILAKQIDRLRPKLKAEDYAALAGEVHFQLGEEARRRFDDFRITERSGTVSANVATKSRFFEELVVAYDRAANAGAPRWATQARFQLAQSAEALADEIAAIPAQTDESITFKARSRYKTTIDRLQGLAKKYYSTNILAARRDPSRYRGDEWVKKSSLRLTGESSDLPENKHKDMIPAAMQSNLPSAWSL